LENKACNNEDYTLLGKFSPWENIQKLNKKSAGGFEL